MLRLAWRTASRSSSLPAGADRSPPGSGRHKERAMMPINTINMKTFNAADGLKLAYYVDDFTDPWRTPETLLLLHAAMGSALRWFNWVPRLSSRYRVVRLDLRGHGNSAVPLPEQTFSLAHLVGDALQLLDLVGA